jgi:hypothetical protein
MIVFVFEWPCWIQVSAECYELSNLNPKKMSKEKCVEWLSCNWPLTTPVDVPLSNFFLEAIVTLLKNYLKIKTLIFSLQK